MGHSYTSLLFHCVFSTKDRCNSITPEIEPRLWAYIGGLARQHGFKALTVGGMEDHLHILLSLPSTVPIANAMRKIKSGSSHWMRESCAQPDFEWQEGYGAFSYAKSQRNIVINYINNQEEHHRIKSFREKYIKMLSDFEIAYQDRYLFEFYG